MPHFLTHLGQHQGTPHGVAGQLHRGRDADGAVRRGGPLIRTHQGLRPATVRPDAGAHDDAVPRSRRVRGGRLCRLVYRSAGSLIGWLIGRLVDWSVDRLVE